MDEDLKKNRELMMENVSSIIIKHILAAELYITTPTEGASLFSEANFKRQEWNIQTTSGYSSTMPLFIYTYQKVIEPVRPCSDSDILKFMRKIIDTMSLANECILVSLIYLEKFMTTSKIEIRFSNWKPLLFTSILLASKFWEDLCFWNADFSEELNFYPLKSINRMESEFISLCDYNIYVSAELYAQYYNNVRQQFKRVGNQITLNEVRQRAQARETEQQDFKIKMVK